MDQPVPEPGPPPEMAFPAATPATPPILPRPTHLQRITEIRSQQRARARRSFLLGLAVGQILVVAVDLLVPLLWKLKLVRPMESGRLPLLVTLGVAAGIALVASLLILLLAVSGIAGLFTKGSLLRGLKRTGRALGAIGLTAAVLLGTAVLLIPRAQWSSAPGEIRSMIQEGWRQIRGR